MNSKDNEIKIIFDFPVSGGSFVVQCAFIKLFSIFKITPDFVCAGSGGNVSAYLGSMAEWDYEKLYKDMKDLSSDLVAKKRYSSTFLNTFLSFFHYSSIYEAGDGVGKIISRHTQRVGKNEIWTCATRKGTSSPRLFCNLSKEQSLVTFKQIEGQISEPYYANMDCKKISNYCQASCAIPSVLPDIQIGEHEYQDSGLSAASCLSQLFRSTDRNNWSQHLKCFIFSPFGIDFEQGKRSSSRMLGSKELVSQIYTSLNSLVYTIYVKDKECILSYLFKEYCMIEIKAQNVSKDYIHDLLSRQNSYLFEVVSSKSFAIPVADFTEETIHNCMKDINIEDCYLRIYFEKDL